MGSALFDAHSLQRAYEFLHRLPTVLLEDVIAHPLGELAERAAGVVRLRQALLAGAIPEFDQSRWPREPYQSAVLSWLRDSGITRFTTGEEELVDAVIGDVLRALASGVELDQSERSRLLSELLEREEAKRIAAATPEEPAKPIDPQMVAYFREQATRDGAGAGANHTGSALRDAWTERIKMWQALSDAFGPLRDILGIGWDLSQGVLWSPESLAGLFQKVWRVEMVMREAPGRKAYGR